MNAAFVVTALAVAGFLVSVLVSGELSRRLGISLTGRVALAGLLGFGVLGLSIKAVVLLSLQSTAALASVADAMHAATPDAERGDPGGHGRGLRYKPRGKAWRPLPVEDTRETDAALVDLGRRLFFDKRLSADGTVACASCHVIPDGGDDDRRTSVGIAGRTGDRNAPTVLNAFALKRLFWDGRASSLEQQALGPLVNPVEMGLSSLDRAVEIVATDPEYRKRFDEAFGTPVRMEAIAEAIAAFERTLVTPGAAYDRFVAGDDTALNDTQKRGLLLFDEIGCRTCHPDPWFTVAAEPHASPYRPFPVFKDSALAAGTGLMADTGRNGSSIWRVPSLRNVGVTAPYFHNGSVDRLEDAVRIMAEAQVGRPVNATTVRVHRDGRGRPTVSKGRTITEADIRDITAFLESLTGEMPEIGRDHLSR